MESTMYFGGVEGGATHSNCVICDQTGKVVGEAKGPGTNHWMLGMEECVQRLLSMVHEAKKVAGIPDGVPLDSLGLTLSGCEQESSNEELAQCVRDRDSACSRNVYVASDTAGSLYTGAPNGGMVLIAGTGSNGFLLTPGGKQYGCGGWGYLLGDEGGAFWIAQRAVKAWFDHTDGLHPSQHNIDAVLQAIRTHFNVHSQSDLLPHAYKNFQKSEFAGLTVKLAELADKGDPLAKDLFSSAGRQLAKHVAALVRRTDANRLRVVCVGSVWKSWELLKPGWLDELDHRNVPQELELVRLRVSSAMGAAFYAAKRINYTLPRDDSAYCEIFYTYQPPSFNEVDNGVNLQNGNKSVKNLCNGSTNGTSIGDHVNNSF